jgi:hypothetical protein
MGNIWFSSPYENKPYTINHLGPYGVWRMVRKPDLEDILSEESGRQGGT